LRKPISLLAVVLLLPFLSGELALVSAAELLQADPLPSWNEGAAKKGILAFVAATTNPASGQFVPPEQRIATFDNDGTMWVEQPMYTQVVFALDQVKDRAANHPEWKTQDPFKAILANDHESMSQFTIQNFERVVAETHSGMSVQQFEAIVKEWLATTKHPRFQRVYTQLVYQPMLEVMSYLRASGYKTYIVTGGGQDFVRTFAETTYGVPSEQVMGSAGKVKYEYQKDGQPVLIKQPSVFIVDDQAGKPEGINLMIGRRPYAAFGNSTGDQQMLEWTQAGVGTRLMMLVHHDDAEREYAYGANSKIGTFSDALMKEANNRRWIVISMKNDWKRIFPFQE
jgi:phosphoglycolate phosphatase-like HAD superfamily hydrolase